MILALNNTQYTPRMSSAITEFETATISKLNTSYALLNANLLSAQNQISINISSYDEIKSIRDKQMRKLLTGMVEQIIIDYLLRLNDVEINQLMLELNVQSIEREPVLKLRQLRIALYMKYLH